MFLDSALALAERGFFVFPLSPGSKFPPSESKGFFDIATRSEARIKQWWGQKNWNIGISTSHFGEDEKLLVVDVDNKPDKNGTKGIGNKSVYWLEKAGCKFPVTYSQLTPTDGKHLFYRTKKHAPNTVKKLADNIDTRGWHGYVLGAGSRLSGSYYKVELDKHLSVAPEWLEERIAASKNKPEKSKEAPFMGGDLSMKRAIEYLKHFAEEAIEGKGGDNTTYKVVCAMKDYGILPSDIARLMMEHWHGGCGWTLQELEKKAEHAYKYGQNAPGNKSTEKAIEKMSESLEEEKGEGAKEEKPKAEDVVLEMNKRNAVIFLDGQLRILHTTLDGNEIFLTPADFKTYYLNKFVGIIGEDGVVKRKQMGPYWLQSRRRKEYSGICFHPGKEDVGKAYNRWKGFAVDPIKREDATPEQIEGCDLFLEHLRKNVLDGNEEYYEWVMGFIADIFQNPGIRPKSAIVLLGDQGTGKSFVPDTIRYILGRNHGVEIDKVKHLTGDFNGHMEAKLLIAVEEAFWSGDRKAEGVLKSLITSNYITIERKRVNSYDIENYARIFMTSNKDWVVPAARDDRRFAIFRTNNNRRKDTAFFGKLSRLLREKGGAGVLLQYFLDWDIKTDVNLPPQTEELLGQKIESLSLIEEWWLKSLIKGRVLGLYSTGEWPLNIEMSELHDAFINEYGKDKRFYQPPSYKSFSMRINKMQIGQRRRKGKGERTWKYSLFPLERCIETMGEYLGHDIREVVSGG